MRASAGWWTIVATTTRIAASRRSKGLYVRRLRHDAAGVEQEPCRAGDPGEVVVPVRLEQDDQVGFGQGGVQVGGAANRLPVALPVGHVRTVLAVLVAAGTQLAGQRPGRRF